MTPRRHVSALTLALAAAAVVATGCGADGETKTVTVAATPAPQLDPPEATEPVAGKPGGPKPGGIVVAVGKKPEGVAIDPETHVVAVAVQDPDALVLLDSRTGKTLRKVALPGFARHVSLAKPGGPFLVPVEPTDELMTVDPRTFATSSTPVGDNPHDATAVGPRYFTADEFGSTMSVVRGGRQVGQTPVDAQPGGVTAVGDQVASIAVRAYTIELFSATDSPRGGGSQSAGLGPSHAVTGPLGRVGITDTRGQALVLYDTDPRLRFRARVPLGGTPVGIAADPGRGTIWLSLSERGQAVPVDVRGEKPKVGRRVNTVINPFSMAVDTDTGRLAVASRTEGTLQLVDP